MKVLRLCLPAIARPWMKGRKTLRSVDAGPPGHTEEGLDLTAAVRHVLAAAACPGDSYDQIVTGGSVIGRILQRSNVSASELARRLGIAEAQVGVWLQGDPPLSVVDSVARACSTDLAKVLAEPEPDPHDVGLLETTLAMTVDQRLDRLKSYVRFVQAGRAALRNVP